MKAKHFTQLSSSDGSGAKMLMSQGHTSLHQKLTIRVKVIQITAGSIDEAML